MRLRGWAAGCGWAVMIDACACECACTSTSTSTSTTTRRSDRPAQPTTPPRHRIRVPLPPRSPPAGRGARRAGHPLRPVHGPYLHRFARGGDVRDGHFTAVDQEVTGFGERDAERFDGVTEGGRAVGEQGRTPLASLGRPPRATPISGPPPSIWRGSGATGSPTRPYGSSRPGTHRTPRRAPRGRWGCLPGRWARWRSVT